MAVLQGITGAVRSQIAGRLNSAVSSTLRNGVGSLSGATREGANSALNTIPSKGKFTTSVMSYPEDVANDPQAGHFILFEIFEFTQGKLKSPKVDKSFEAEGITRVVRKEISLFIFSFFNILIFIPNSRSLIPDIFILLISWFSN